MSGPSCQGLLEPKRCSSQDRRYARRSGDHASAWPTQAGSTPREKLVQCQPGEQEDDAEKDDAHGLRERAANLLLAWLGKRYLSRVFMPFLPVHPTIRRTRGLRIRNSILRERDWCRNAVGHGLEGKDIPTSRRHCVMMRRLPTHLGRRCRALCIAATEREAGDDLPKPEHPIDKPCLARCCPIASTMATMVLSERTKRRLPFAAWKSN